MPNPMLPFSQAEIDRLMSDVVQMLHEAPNSILPDPKVAAIVFSPDGRPLARYNKQQFGEPHSEAQVVLRALTSLLRQQRRQHSSIISAATENHLASFRRKLFTPRSIRNDRDLSDLRSLVAILGDPLRDCSLFVNLEPCGHFGKNPACAAIILASGIRKVFFSHYDPDPDVCGKGEKMLRESGVFVSRGYQYEAALRENQMFCHIAYYMPKLFGGIHPTADVLKKPPLTMLGLYVPKSEVRTTDFGKTISVHTFGVPPLRHTVEQLRKSGRPRLSPRAFQRIPTEPSAVMFTTLLNPVAIIEMIYRRFGKVPAGIISATPDMGFELGKEECVDMIMEYCPDTHICVGVRMAAIRDKLARISLRRRLSVERNRAGKVAIVIMAKGVPLDRVERVETRFVDLVGATTVHVSRLEEYLIMLRFLREDVDATVYIGGDLFAGRWREKTIENIRKLVDRAKRVHIRCTEEEVVNALRAAGVPRVAYLEPYWEIV